jgi:ubiquinone/menaquinone biosynthesis C-methylase UbiE
LPDTSLSGSDQPPIRCNACDELGLRGAAGAFVARVRPRPGPFASWSDVDSDTDATAYFAYLDAMDAAAGIAATRLRTYELLDAAPGHRIVDVGAGTGTAALALASIVAPGGHVVGVDRSEAMVVEASRRRSDRTDCEFVVGDATALAFDDASFDGYRAERLYEHLADPALALAEARRVLRPGGRLVIAEPDWDAMIVDAPDKELTRQILAAVADCQTQPWIGRQLRRLLLDAGFADVSVEPRTSVMTNFGSRERGGMRVVASLAATSLGRARVDRWVAGVEERAAGGGLFAATTFFVAAATR